MRIPIEIKHRGDGHTPTPLPLSRELGTNKTVKARSCPWLEPFLKKTSSTPLLDAFSLGSGIHPRFDALQLFFKLAPMHYLSGSLNPLLASIPPKGGGMSFAIASRRVWGGSEHWHNPPAASDRRGNSSEGFNDFYLKATARMRRWLSYMCHIRSTAV